MLRTMVLGDLIHFLGILEHAQFLLYLIFNPPGTTRSFFIWVDSVDIPTPLHVFVFLVAAEQQF